MYIYIYTRIYAMLELLRAREARIGDSLSRRGPGFRMASDLKLAAARGDLAVWELGTHMATYLYILHIYVYQYVTMYKYIQTACTYVTVPVCIYIYVYVCLYSVCIYAYTVCICICVYMLYVALLPRLYDGKAQWM